MSAPVLRIGHLYPRELNLFSDSGNVLALKRQAEWRGIDAEIVEINADDRLPGDLHIAVIGGGAASSVAGVQGRLLEQREVLERRVLAGLPLLAVGTGFYLLTEGGEVEPGISLAGTGLFRARVRAGERRAVSQVRLKVGGREVIGFENHSGIVYPGPRSATFGRVVYGYGNNGCTRPIMPLRYEGMRRRNAIGTHLHGPVLALNPWLAEGMLRVGLDLAGIDYRGAATPEIARADELARETLLRFKQNERRFALAGLRG